MKEYADTLNFKKKKNLYTELSNKFNINLVTAKKYYLMTEDEMPNPDKPKHYNSYKCKLNGYRNIVYKMARDKISPVIIKEYVKHKGFLGTDRSIEKLIECVLRNNFNIKLNIDSFKKNIEAPGLIAIERNDLLKYITTKNSNIKKNKNIEKYISLIKEKYPIVDEIISVYDDFYNIFKEKEESYLDEFINKYDSENRKQENDEQLEIDDNIENVKSGIQGFIKSIKKDIAPIKAAISFNESSGFVEGNNNKFKLVKRILYGRCHLVNLFKKCFSIFSLKSSSNIFSLLNFYGSIPNQA